MLWIKMTKMMIGWWLVRRVVRLNSGSQTVWKKWKLHSGLTTSGWTWCWGTTSWGHPRTFSGICPTSWASSGWWWLMSAFGHASPAGGGWNNNLLIYHLSTLFKKENRNCSSEPNILMVGEAETSNVSRKRRQKEPEQVRWFKCSRCSDGDWMTGVPARRTRWNDWIMTNGRSLTVMTRWAGWYVNIGNKFILLLIL